MKRALLLTVLVVLGLLSCIVPVLVGPFAHAAEPIPPAVFQAAGPTAASIQGAVDAFRAHLGEPNNGNSPGPLPAGRREINWDGGGGVDVTTPPVTPFDGFLNSRGGRFVTPGTGLSQAPPAGGPEGGLAVLFNNPNYATTFAAFSPLRLFTPVGSNVTDASFFIPGTNGATPAVVRGFGVVFADVDQRFVSTMMRFFGADGKLLFHSSVPASPGEATFSFFGIAFDDPRIAWARIITGSVPPGPDDAEKDVVVMDDFIYGEPQAVQ
jgi:hypothetical protein